MLAFPLLKVPLLVQKLIFSMIEPADVIELALFSKPFYRHVQLIKIRCATLTWEFDNKFSFIKLEFPEKSARKFRFFLKPGKVQMKYREIHEDVKLVGWFIRHYTMTWAGYMEKYTEIFSKILIVSDYQLIIESFNGYDFYKFFIWKFEDKISRFYLIDPAGNGKEEARARYILENRKFKYVSIATLSTIKSSKIHPPSVIKHEELLMSSDFLDFEYYLRMECKWVLAYRQTVEDEEIRAFIRTWIHSEGLQDLEFFAIFLVSGQGWLKQETVLQGVKHVEWNQEARPSAIDLQVTGKNCDILGGLPSNGRDIRRKSDGQLATVIVCFDLFVFIVWNDELRRKIVL